MKRSVLSLLAVIAVVLSQTFSQTASPSSGRTLQSFGVRVERGHPVRPYPANVALGLFNVEDHFLDIAYVANSRVQVFQNLGNGLFSDAPVFEMRVSSDVKALKWRLKGFLLRGPSDLVVTYADGREETIAHEWMAQQRKSFSSLPQRTSSFPPLNFREVWKSKLNHQPTSFVHVGDIDNDGRTEAVYTFYGGLSDTTDTLTVFENYGNDLYRIDWDSVVAAGPCFAITDIDYNGHKEIVIPYNGPGLGLIGLLECYGPRQYRFYHTNIGFDRPPFKVLETDINHNGTKELTVLTSDPSRVQDKTIIYVAEFVSKGRGGGGWSMVFNQELARYQFYTFDMAVGQVDGAGRDEIVPAGGSLGYDEPVPIDYLWHTGVIGPSLWRVRQIHTGLESGTASVMFVNLDADTTKEFVSGAPGPVHHGSMFALKYVSDTTWRVLWADSSLRNSPLYVHAGFLAGASVVAGANSWYSDGLDSIFSDLRVYRPDGKRIGIWHRDLVSIQDFYLNDIDGDAKSELAYAEISNSSRLMIFESDMQTGFTTESSSFSDGFTLYGNYPNPFNSQTTLKFLLTASGNVTVTIYDLLGKEVKRLLKGEIKPGTRIIWWDGTNERGRYVASGVYLTHVVFKNQQGTSVVTRKMLLVR
jgi:hypothetical protein